MPDGRSNPLVSLMDVVADAIDWIHDTFSDEALSRELRSDLGIEGNGAPQGQLPSGEKIRMRHPNGDPVDVDKAAFDATVAEVRAALRLLADFLGSMGLSLVQIREAVTMLCQIGAAESIRARWPRWHGVARAAGFLNGLGSGEEVEAFDVLRAVDLLGGRTPARNDVTDPIEDMLAWIGLAGAVAAAAKGDDDALPVRLRAAYGHEPEPDSKTPAVDHLARTAFTIAASTHDPASQDIDQHVTVTVIYVPGRPDGTRFKVNLAIGGGISFTDGRFTAALEAPARTNILMSWPWEINAGGLVRGVASYGRKDAQAFEFGETDGPHISVDTIELRVELSEDSSLRLELKGIELSLALSDADNFISSLSQQLSTRFDVAVVLDGNGLRLDSGSKSGTGPQAPPTRALAATSATASGGHEADVPADVTQFGPFRIHNGHIALGRSADPARHTSIEMATSAGLDLGPFAVTIDRIGMSLDLRAGGADPNLGLLDLDFGFKPPTGIGLSIDTPAVSGGGFLDLDSAAGRYAGDFALTLAGKISVRAMAIVTTRLPDGSDGFSLLIVITAQGFTPVQLGMGFTLTGIGGLLALNRTVDANAVRGGLSDGALDAVLFAKDPVGSIDRILSTLETIFPPAPDRLVVGPMAEISWGSPPLVKLRIALLLEIPQPIRAVLLAALSVVLPRAKDAVVELHVDAIGVLDLGRGELALDAALHHSRLLQFALTGEMALRCNWGEQPTFLLSVGGFHPRFAAPRGLRPLKRLALTLTEGTNPRVRLEAYLALTSNTIQMGARVTLRASKGGFGIEGSGSFDALIQWSPFAIDVEFAAWARIFSPAGTLVAVSVAVNVTGPRPWHVSGKATVRVLFFSFTVGIDLYLGEAAAPEPVETVDVAALLWEQISDRGNWQAVLPPAQSPGVALTAAGAVTAGAPLVAHPLSVISIRQRVVPLGTAISRVGAAVPVQGTRAYDLDVSVAGGNVALAVVDELFAPAQYRRMPDDAQLTQPSFVRMPAGVSAGAATGSSAGPALACDLAVETLDVTDLDDLAAGGALVAAAGA